MPGVPKLSRFVTMLVAVMVSAASTACGPERALVVVNRSDAPLAIWPGVVVEPCSSIELTREAVDAANERFDAAFDRGDFTWVPPGAVQYRRGISGAPIGAPKPLVLVVSGIADPTYTYGSIDTEAMPPCGGQPVGVN